MRARALLLLVLLLAGPARAAPDPVPPLTLDVQAGLIGDETARTGWTPFEVLLTGGPEPLELVVELALSDTNDQLLAGQGWRCERAVSLPPAQRRRLWFVAPIRPRRGNVFYRVAARTAGAEPADLASTGPRTLVVELRNQTYYSYSRHEPRPAVLVVSDSTEPRDVDWLSRGRRVRYVEPPRLGLRRPESLPESSAAYDAIDLVAIRDADLGALRPAQADALVDWVEDGGVVLLVPPRDPAWFAERTVSRLVGGRKARLVDRVALPDLVAPDGIRITSPRASAVVLDGARPVDLEYGQRHLRVDEWLQGVPRGTGEVWLLAADLALPPFAAWHGADVLGAAVTAPRRPRPSSAACEPEETVAALQAVSIRDAPARWLVVGLVVVYVLVVGPLNDRLLRRRGALLLLVATIPAVAVAWTLLVFCVGWATKGLSTVSRRVTLVSVRQGETLARERTIVGLRAASAGEYDVAFGPGLEALQLARPSEPAAAASAEVALDGQGVQRHRVALRLWSQAAFEATGLRRLRAPLTLSSAAGVTTLENGSELELAEVVVVGGEATLVGGPAPAGGRAALAPWVASPDDAGPDLREYDRELRHGADATLLALALRLGADAQDAPALAGLLQGLGVSPGAVVARLAAPPSAASVDGRARADRELLLLVAHPPRPEGE